MAAKKVVPSKKPAVKKTVAKNVPGKKTVANTSRRFEVTTDANGNLKSIKALK